MSVYVIVPIKSLDNSKIRLSSVFNSEIRKKISHLMMRDIFESLSLSKEVDQVVVISSDKLALEMALEKGFSIIREDKDEGVNKAVFKANEYSLEMGAASTLVIPADIPLLKPSDIQHIISTASQSESALIIPSLREDGTNALFRTPPNIIETSYDKESYRTHIQLTLEKNILLFILRMRNIMLDIDTIGDIYEFMSEESQTETYHFLSNYAF
jgi:2-phospho-L-lactate guanylyltransferase